MSDENEKTTRVSQVPRMTKGNIRSNNIEWGASQLSYEGVSGKRAEKT